jgi:predicted metal-binding membrane protein
MNLFWVALIAGFVFVEKLMPDGRPNGCLVGVGLRVAGVAMILERT